MRSLRGLQQLSEDMRAQQVSGISLGVQQRVSRTGGVGGWVGSASCIMGMTSAFSLQVKREKWRMIEGFRSSSLHNMDWECIS